MPKTRAEFWSDKFAANIARDARNNARLTEMGWRVVTVWECETKDAATLEAILSGLEEPAILLGHTPESSPPKA